jgi:hypothetical protein
MWGRICMTSGAVLVGRATVVCSGCFARGCEHTKPVAPATHPRRVEQPDCGTRARLDPEAGVALRGPAQHRRAGQRSSPWRIHTPHPPRRQARARRCKPPRGGFGPLPSIRVFPLPIATKGRHRALAAGYRAKPTRPVPVDSGRLASGMLPQRSGTRPDTRWARRVGATYSSVRWQTQFKPGAGPRRGGPRRRGSRTRCSRRWVSGTDNDGHASHSH